MISTYEIIGKAVDQLIHEGNGEIDRDMLARHLMEEFIRASNSGSSQAEGAKYEAAMRMVMRTDKIPRGW
ncbi:hypothetical protein ACJ8J6_01020 [Serratia sp. CY47279]|uniref:hypothetical protein n=1 Tax=Serratia sp. CY47279 TaxID=3383624 RepID=UPI003F9F89FA